MAGLQCVKLAWQLGGVSAVVVRGTSTYRVQSNNNVCWKRTFSRASVVNSHCRGAEAVGLPRWEVVIMSLEVHESERGDCCGAFMDDDPHRRFIGLLQRFVQLYYSISSPSILSGSWLSYSILSISPLWSLVLGTTITISLNSTTKTDQRPTLRQ
jgi:hypothetical protein